MKTKFDFILVGQGLAGTMLSHFLIKNGKSVFIIDNYNSSSSSNIAAGIIHPITGRRLVKSWLLDTAYIIAKSTYQEIEEKFRQQFFQDTSILEIYTSIKNRNDWIALTADVEMDYLIDHELKANALKSVEMPYGGMVLKPTGFLHIKKLLSAYRSYFEIQQCISNDNFSFDNLILNENELEYNGIIADKIIFCEGFHAYQNPYFITLPYQFAKGEILILECPGLSEEFIINKSIYIQPLANQKFRVGATYDWEKLDFEPTNGAREKLTEQFKSVVSLPFEIVEHYAAVRPTVKGRRPLMGMHPLLKQIGIFNGLGTKGVLLAPYLANHFTEHLLLNTALRNEVSIESRF